MTDLELALEHKYVVTPGGQPCVSATTLAKLIDDGKTEALMKWADRLAKEGKNHIEERDRLGDLGTRVHKHLPSWSQGLGVDARPDELGFLDAAAKFMVDYEPHSIEQEQVVVSAKGVGGRFDDISQIGPDIWGLDWKTGTVHDRENEIQHSIYWNADGIAVYNTEGMLTGTRPMPNVTRWASVYLRADGTYDFREYPRYRRGQKGTPIKVLQDRAYETALKLLDVYCWLHPSKGIA